MRRAFFLLSVIACIIFLSSPALAASDMAVYHQDIYEDSLLSVYVQDPGPYESISCQIGRESVSDVIAKSGSEVVIDTYILIDNSQSIQQKYWDTMKQVAKYLVYGKQDKERFTIATFDTEPHYLIENSFDTAALVQAIDSIEFQNLDTKVIDVFYNVFNRIESDSEDSFRRIVFMSDGVDTLPTAYTQEELIARAKKNGYPIYTLGCTFQSNNSELQNMFRLSRETNAGYFYLDDAGTADQIAASISDSFRIAQVQIRIPENQMDGADKGVQVVFATPDGAKEATFTQTMPFLSQMSESETSSNLEPSIETNGEFNTTSGTVTGSDEGIPVEAENITDLEQMSDPMSEAISNDMQGVTTELWNEQELEVGAEHAGLDKFLEENGMGSLISYKWFIIGGIIVLILVIILLIVLKKRRKKVKDASAYQYYHMDHDKTEIIGENDKTEIIGENDKTEILDGDETLMSGILNIRLFDVARPSSIKEFALSDSVIIGRDKNKARICFDYEKSISGEHCRIYRMQGRIYIEDLQSSNGTYVDGLLITEPTELHNGAVIGLGRLQIQFQIF